MSRDAEKWDTIYKNGNSHQHQHAAKVLTGYAWLLPETGKALDLACGKGANAIFLAENGFKTHAWDVSAVAIDHLNKTAEDKNLSILTEVRDVISNPPASGSFDVIVVSYFLDRTLFKYLIPALRPDGLLYYQTFIQERIDDSGPRNNDYRLETNELLKLCRDLVIRVYHEAGSTGDIRKGIRNEALLVGQQKR